jgi:hypothetical protein
MILFGILISLFSLAGIFAMYWAFVWAARKDGDDDLERQRKSGTKRSTRIGL